MYTMERGREPQPVVGGLGRLYENYAALHWPLIRATAGIILFTHGWPKFQLGVQAVAANTLAKRGIEPSMAFAYALIFLETVGALLITIGLLTRPVAVALVVEFAVIVYHQMPNGYTWVKGGYEYPLFWGLIFLAIALRGGGPYSVDRAIGREL